jgi:predicted HTH domain antitoxin
MKQMTISYPETMPTALNVSQEDFEAEARMALATKLYEMGRLTSGQAAELAGVSRVGFLLNCKRFGVPSVAWSREEIAAEFEGDLS